LTRELAQQIEKEVQAFSRLAEEFKTSIVVGGTNIYEQRSKLRAGKLKRNSSRKKRNLATRCA
jgi:superfamily II DNA/RNA helicase